MRVIDSSSVVRVSVWPGAVVLWCRVMPCSACHHTAWGAPQDACAAAVTATRATVGWNPRAGGGEQFQNLRHTYSYNKYIERVRICFINLMYMSVSFHSRNGGTPFCPPGRCSPEHRLSVCLSVCLSACLIHPQARGERVLIECFV